MVKKSKKKSNIRRTIKSLSKRSKKVSKRSSNLKKLFVVNTNLKY